MGKYKCVMRRKSRLAAELSTLCRPRRSCGWHCVSRMPVPGFARRRCAAVVVTMQPVCREIIAYLTARVPYDDALPPAVETAGYPYRMPLASCHKCLDDSGMMARVGLIYCCQFSTWVAALVRGGCGFGENLIILR